MVYFSWAKNTLKDEKTRNNFCAKFQLHDASPKITMSLNPSASECFILVFELKSGSSELTRIKRQKLHRMFGFLVYKNEVPKVFHDFQTGRSPFQKFMQTHESKMDKNFYKL